MTLSLDRIESIRRAVTLGTVFAVPVIVAFGVGLRDPFNTPKVALLIVAVSVIASLRLAEVICGARLSGLERLAIPALGFAIPLFLAWLASPDRAFSLSGADYGRYQGLVPYLLAVALGVLVADGFAGRAERINWALGIAGTVVALYALLQFFGLELPNGPGGTRGFVAVSSLGNPNFTGGFIAICLGALAPFALGSAPSSSVARKLVFVMAIGLGRSFTQGGWIAGIAGVAIALGFVLAPRWGRARIAGTTIAVVMAVGSVGAVLAAMAGVEHSVLSTARSRGLTWESAVRAAEAKPLLGHGLNTFGQVQPEYRSEEALRDQQRRGSVPDDPHSLPLAMMVNGGLVTFLGWITAVVWFVVMAMKVPSGSATGAGLVGATTAYLVQSLSSIDEVSLRVAFWVCLGGLAAFLASAQSTDGENARKSQNEAAPERPPAMRSVVAATVVVISTVVSFVLAARFLDVHRT